MTKWGSAIRTQILKYEKISDVTTELKINSLPVLRAHNNFH
jgi:hypothetical protein